MRPIPTLLAGLVLLAAMCTPASAAEQVFDNANTITIPNVGSAQPYPSGIDVQNVSGRVTDVKVTLRGVTHSRPNDLDVLLVSPDGHTSVVMSDACGDPLQNANFIFTTSAAAGMPNSSGTCDQIFYKPTDYGASETWPGAPDAHHFADLTQFAGDNPNGTWKLYVIDDYIDYPGKINLGWALTLDTSVPDATVPGDRATGAANPYPITRTVSGVDGVITDVNVAVPGIYHRRPDDLDLMLEGPQGQKVMLMSDSCAYPLAGVSLTLDDEASAPMSSLGDCVDGASYKPTDHEPGDTLPAPAPAGPYGTELSAFDGTVPNGDWRLYAADDNPDSNDGMLTDRYSLQLQTRPQAKVAFTEGAVDVTEGQTRQLTVARPAAAALGPGSVKVTSAPRSATSGTDYEPVATTVDFAAGQTTKTIPVQALADDAVEGPETFAVSLSQPTGDADLGTPATTVVTIRDATPQPLDPTPGTPGTGTGGGTGGTGGTNAGAAPGIGPTSDHAAPVIGNVRVTRKAITYTLSEPADVTLQFQRVGHRGRNAAAGTLHASGDAGANRVPFRGRVGRRALRSGRYRLTVTAVDRAGNQAIAASGSFRIPHTR